MLEGGYYEREREKGNSMMMMSILWHRTRNKRGRERKKESSRISRRRKNIVKEEQRLPSSFSSLKQSTMIDKYFIIFLCFIYPLVETVKEGNTHNSTIPPHSSLI